MPENSLRRRLLLRLWIPLTSILIVGAICSFGLAYHFGNVVHDRWLLDSAMTLATQLKVDTGKLSLDLSPSSVEMFEWDSVDRIYEEVVSPNGRRLFGNAEFPPPPEVGETGQPSYYDTTIAGDPVRVVAVAVRSPADPARTVTIQVAETRKKRQALVWEIILAVVPLLAAILLAAGAFIWFAVTSSLASLDGFAARISGYEPESLRPLHDVEQAPSEVRPLIAALNGLIARLIDAQGTQQRFIANAAHQLRTPLAALQVQTERALREKNPERHSEALDHVVKAVSRLRHLTQQLLTLTRSDPSAASALDLQPIDLAEHTRDELGHWTDAALKRGVDLGYEGPESGVIVRGEAHLLRELIGNLVDNAIRYGNPGGQVTVGVCASPVSIFVEDDGPGIALTERDRVLDAFYRVPGSDGDGCGLGLTIAREIAARHGATLAIGERAPRGARLDVVFL